MKYKKRFSNILIYISLIIVFNFVSSCTNKTTDKTTDKTTIIEESNNRIKLNGCTKIDGVYFYIIEIDSVEYLTQYNGGFIKINE